MNYTGVNEKIKVGVIIFLVIIFLLISFCFRNLLSQCIQESIILFLISFVIFYYLSFTLCYKAFSTFFFKIPFFKNLIPNFNGVWKGKGKSSFDPKKSFDVILEIKQGLTDISVNATFNQSKSEAFNCYIKRENNKEKLIYNYSNEPKPTEELDFHYGTMILEKKEKKLEGNYFTNREPQTKVEFTLERKINLK